MRFTLFIAALSALVAACGGGDAGSITEFDDVPQRIEVDIAAGNVTVTGNANISGVSIDTEIDGDATPSFELANGVLTVNDDCTSDCRIDYSILTEGEATVVIATDDGNVSVNQLTGAVTVDATNGAVSLASVVGDLQIIVGEGSVLGTRLESTTATFEAIEGNIDVTFDEVVTTLVIATDRGDVTVQLPDAAYAFDTTPEDQSELRIDNTPDAANTVVLSTGDGEVVVYRR